jgi:hypothetical protein
MWISSGFYVIYLIFPGPLCSNLDGIHSIPWAVLLRFTSKCDRQGATIVSNTPKYIQDFM